MKDHVHTALKDERVCMFQGESKTVGPGNCAQRKTNQWSGNVKPFGGAIKSNQDLAVEGQRAQDGLR